MCWPNCAALWARRDILDPYGHRCAAAVFIGKATCAADRQLDDKTYEATLRLGLRTDTGDVTGATLETAPVTVGEAELRAVLPAFWATGCSCRRCTAR